MFIIDIERGVLACELSCSNQYGIAIDSVQYAFSSRNHFLFVKCYTNDENSVSKLLCHSLRLISKLDDYFGTNQHILNNCLPLNTSLSERIKNLMQNR